MKRKGQVFSVQPATLGVCIFLGLRRTKYHFIESESLTHDYSEDQCFARTALDIRLTYVLCFITLMIIKCNLLHFPYRLIPSWCCYHNIMTLNTQRDKEPLRRRGSTPIPPLYQQLSGTWDLRRSLSTQPERPGPTRSHPPLGQSASYHPGDKSLHYRAHWSSDSDDDSQSESECVYRVVLLGDHGVGKTSLAGIFAGITEKDDQPGGGMLFVELFNKLVGSVLSCFQQCLNLLLFH